MLEFLIISAIIIAGPLIGSLIGVIRKPSMVFTKNMLAFAAGVMLAISFLELIPESIEFISDWNESLALLFSCIGIILGATVMFILDRAIPHVHPEMCEPEHGSKNAAMMKRTATYLFIGIFLHNFPEGITVAIGTVSGFELTLTLAIAIMIHNIPEGICTSSPLYYATKKRWKAFLISLTTAIPEIIGFLLGTYLFGFIPMSILGVLIAATAGLMIYISGDELIPTSCCEVKKKFFHSTIFSLILGVVLVLMLGYI
jgi:ZIP family zinc transporter